MDLTTLLQTEHGQQCFMEFLKKEISHENLEFWLQCQGFERLTDKKQIKKLSIQIFDKYIAPRGSHAVNIDHNIRKELEQSLKKPHAAMFEVAKNHIFHLMRTDPFPRFLQSELFANYQSMFNKDSQPYKMNSTRKRKRIEECTNDSCVRHTYENESAGKNVKISSSDVNSDRYLDSISREQSIKQNFENPNCQNTFMFSDRDISDSESLYCNAPIYSVDFSPKSSQQQQNYSNLVDPKWLKNRFLRIIFPDCSEEFISTSQRASIRFLVDNLLRDKRFNYSSYKMFSVQTNESIDIEQNISAVVFTDVRIERRINFSIHFPEGFLINVEAMPNKMAFSTIKTILSHFGIDLQDIELIDEHGYLLNEKLTTQPSFDLDLLNIHVNYLSSLRTYINLNDICDLGEDGITIKDIQFKECNRPKRTRKNKPSSVSKSCSTFVIDANLKANTKENLPTISHNKEDRIYTNIYEEMTNINLTDLSFSNETATDDFLTDLMVNDVYKLNFVCTPTKRSKQDRQDLTDNSHFYENVNYYANTSNCATLTANREKTPTHKAKFVIIEDEYENEMSSQRLLKTAKLTDCKENFISFKQIYMNEPVLDPDVCYNNLKQSILKAQNMNYQQTVHKQQVRKTESIKTQSPISFINYLLPSSTCHQSAASSELKSKVTHTFQSSDANNDNHHRTPLRKANMPDLVASTSNKANRMKTLSQFHKII